MSGIRVRNKSLCLILLCMLISASLIGCSAEKQPDNDRSSIPTPTQAGFDDSEGDNNENKMGLKSFIYYTVDTEINQSKSAVAMIPADSPIQPEFIVNKIVEALGDEGLVIEYNSVVNDNGKCIIDFTDTMSKISEDDADLEVAILDAFAKSILDNVKECNSIAFRIDGNAYVTANKSFSLDEVYMGD